MMIGGGACMCCHDAGCAGCPCCMGTSTFQFPGTVPPPQHTGNTFQGTYNVASTGGVVVQQKPVQPVMYAGAQPQYVQPAGYGAQPGMYPPQAYGGQPQAYGAPMPQYGQQPMPYGGQPMPYGQQQPMPYGGAQPAVAYGAPPQQYGVPMTAVQTGGGMSTTGQAVYPAMAVPVASAPPPSANAPPPAYTGDSGAATK